VLPHGLRAEKDTLLVDTHDAVPGILRDVYGELANVYASVVDQDVDVTPLVCDLPYHCFDGNDLGHVERNHQRTVPCRSYLCCCLFGIVFSAGQLCGDHVRAGVRQGRGERPPHATPGPGDDGNLVVQSECGESRFICHSSSRYLINLPASAIIGQTRSLVNS
jgi:hypothetical protein